MKISHELNTDIVKSQVSAIQKAIKETLKVDAGRQTAYHIFSVSHFLKNDQELKPLLKKDSYTLTANLGTKENPCIIKHELGLFDNENFAKYEAEQFIRNCQKQIEWNLLKNGELLTVGNDYIYTINSKPTPSKGLQVEITLSADKIDDIEWMLENVSTQIEQGKNVGLEKYENMNFKFEVFGEEYDVIADIDCILEDDAPDFIIFDSKEILKSSKNDDEVIHIWETRDDFFESWENFLIYAEQVDLQTALENDNHTYHAISPDTKTRYSGEIMDILDAIKNENEDFHLYLELERD